MVVVMATDATAADIAAVVARVEGAGGEAFVSRGVTRTIVGLVGDLATFGSLNLAGLAGVSNVVSISAPYKLVARAHHPDMTTVWVGSEGGRVPIGPDTFTLIAGPCAVETPDQTLEAAQMAAAAGATLLRGGAYKPRTSPYDFQGMEEEGLKLLQKAKKATGLAIITEVMSDRDVDLIAQYADIMQVGARNMQNFMLLKALGKCGRPVLLKRGMSGTIKELLMSAEYIVAHGNSDVILCERGIRTFETETRNTCDIAAIPALNELTHLPVILDPSHATGKRSLVPAVSRAGVAIGADGLIVEVHPAPEKAISDGAQSLDIPQFHKMMNELQPYIQLWKDSRRRDVPAAATAGN